MVSNCASGEPLILSDQVRHIPRNSNGQSKALIQKRMTSNMSPIEVSTSFDVIKHPKKQNELEFIK